MPPQVISQTTSPVFEMKAISHAYEGQTVLQIDRLAISPGSIVGVIGPNGSGKSTLLRLLGLIEKPDQGKILYNGQQVSPFSSFARFDIALLPQEPFLMKRNVFQNVSFGLTLRGDNADAFDRTCEALSLTGLAGKDFLKRPWYALSVGETQRVALAARLALRPKVLLLDEPTASVDSASARLIKDAALNARTHWGTTLIIAGHDRQWLDQVCDTMLHLHKSTIFGNGGETLVFGPWKELENGRWGRKLPDGQKFWVSKPPDQEATALIDNFSVNEKEISQASEDMALCGTVSRLIWRKNCGLIATCIMAADISFVADFTQNQVQDQRLMPGKNVFIHYNPKKTTWL
jgi:tungstate transport system ATP-binding protein